MTDELDTALASFAQRRSGELARANAARGGGGGELARGNAVRGGGSGSSTMSTSTSSSTSNSDGSLATTVFARELRDTT